MTAPVQTDSAAALCYLNGKLLPLAAAKVSVMDRGFLFGDGVYEVIPVYSRRPFRLAEHLRRLQASLDGIRLPNPHGVAEWTALIERVIAAAAFADQSLYLQITRGPAAVRNHAFPAQCTPTVFVLAEPLTPPAAALQEQGVAAVTAQDIRWQHCDWKVTSLLANCLLRQIAIDAGCMETVLLRDGLLTEGAAANIFVVKDGVLLAPPKNQFMLPGITYDILLELAAQHRLPTRVGDITEHQLRAADELWLTSSTKEVLPIVRLDGQAVGLSHPGRPGPQYARIKLWYQAFKEEVMRRG